MATYIIKQKNELAKILEAKITIWLEEKAKLIKEEYIEEFLQSEFYDQYESKIYLRTKQIIASATSTNIVKNGNSYLIEVYLDSSKAQYFGDLYGTNGIEYPPTDGDPLKVWSNMNEGYHGFVEKTDGHFWDELIEQLGHGGKYDLYANFKKYLDNKGSYKVVK